SEPGVYTNFGGIEVEDEDGLVILSYNGTEWSKQVVDLPFDLTEVDIYDRPDVNYAMIDKNSLIIYVDYKTTEEDGQLTGLDIDFEIYDRPDVNYAMIDKNSLTIYVDYKTTEED